MILYPAIDIMDGQAVRLVEGKFEDSTKYHDDPLEAAKSWVAAGARFLHVVDLAHPPSLALDAQTTDEHSSAAAPGATIWETCPRLGRRT